MVINNICPFCTTDFDSHYQEEKKLFTDSYTKSNVKNIREMLGYFEQVAEYMDPEKRDAMYTCIKDSTDEETITKWITDFYNDLDFLVGKIKRIIEFNAYHVKQEEISVLADQLDKLIIDPASLSMFNSEKTISLIVELNKRIKTVAVDVDKLKQEIGTLKGFIHSSLQKAVGDVNEFLNMASIDYELEIQHLSEKETKTILKYKPPGQDSVVVDDIKKSLSWGERNAFALVLFMHYAQSQNPDLVILDDPISSFDSNKKYAIINRLFLNNPSKKSLYKKTALMLTHDFQPVIDFIINSKPHGGSANAAFLRNDGGEVIQTDIKDCDIRPFALLLSENAARKDLNKVHRVTSLRKLYEHTKSYEGMKLEYNLLSCLLKAKAIPSYANDVLMTDDEISEAHIIIKQHIEDFDYNIYLKNVFNQEELSKLYLSESVDYFKLQVFRILLEINDLRSKIADPILKYIDEQFHIENDYVFYLDYTKFNTVPNFVLPKCTEFLQNEKVI
jgi:ABC-type dipeptide/oligopeptide/nickel transport system ATPase subunit